MVGFEFEYISLVTARPEKDKKGRDYIIVRITNEFIRELKSAEQKYIEFKEEHYNPSDSVDKKEMAVSKQIRQEIHEIWKMLNSGVSHAAGGGPTGPT